MKWLLADIGDKNGLMQTSDVLTEMPLTARKNAPVGNTSFLNSGSSSHRQSTNIMFTANDK